MSRPGVGVATAGELSCTLPLDIHTRLSFVVSFFCFLESSTFFQRLAILLVTSFLGAVFLAGDSGGVGRGLGLNGRLDRGFLVTGLRGRFARRRSISELLGVRLGAAASAAVRRL